MKKTLKMLLIFAIVCVFAILIPNEVAAVSISTEADLRKAIEVDNEAEITLDADIEVTGTTGLTTRETGFTLKNDIVINGNGHKISSSTIRTLFDVFAYEGDDADNAATPVTITFNNVKLVSTDANARCIDTRTGKVTLNLNSVIMDATGCVSGNAQTLTIGGKYPISKINTINVTSSTLLAGKNGYGIIVYNPVNLNVTSSDIDGYSALYMKSTVDINGPTNAEGASGSKVVIDNSVLSSKNDSLYESNVFGTIVLEDTGVTLKIKNSEVIAGGEGLGQVAIAESIEVESTKGNSVEVSDSTIIANTAEELVEINNDNTSVTFNVGVSSNVEIPENLLPAGTKLEKDENGNNVIVPVKYKVTVKEATNGKVVANVTEAAEGTTVELDITPDEGYVLDAVVVEGLAQETIVENNKFTMPANDVTVSATFKAEPVDEDKDDTVTPPIGEGTEGSKEEVKDEAKDESPKTGAKSLVIFFVVAAVLGLAISKKERGF